MASYVSFRQLRTFPQQKASLFNDLVGALLEYPWHIEAKHLGGLEIKHQIVLGRCLHRQVGRLFALYCVGKFDLYVEDDYAASVRYCFWDPLDAEIFRSRFEPKIERLRLAG